MAFVNEEMPAEIKAQFDPKVFRDPHVPNRPISTSRWTIDRERDVFIVRLGGGGPWEGGDAPKPREYLALMWKDAVVKFEALVSAEGVLSNWSSRWDVLAMNIPPILQPQRDTILEFIRDGLEVMANSGAHSEGCTKVTVTFNPGVTQ